MLRTRIISVPYPNMVTIYLLVQGLRDPVCAGPDDGGQLGLLVNDAADLPVGQLVDDSIQNCLSDIVDDV